MEKEINIKVQKNKKRGYFLVESVLLIITYMLLANGLFTIFSSTFSTLNASNVALQAQQYAELDASLIKLVDYDNLTLEESLAEVKLHTNRGAIQSVEATGWEDEVIIGPEQTPNEDSDSKYRIATINIYKEGDTLARYSLQVPLSSQGSGRGLPIGSIIAWPADSLPTTTGIWLECNGQSCDKYPKLVSILGSNTVPDYRGVFLRGHGQHYSYHYGTVLHSSATLGELQGDTIRNIWGNTGINFGVLEENSHPQGVFFETGQFAGRWITEAWDMGLGFDASRVVPTANENRPVNKAVRWLIKAQ